MTAAPATASETGVILRVLGAAAGGGVPQWNCACPGCAAARAGVIPPMTQSSVAVSVDGRAWALLNASPDIGVQVRASPALAPQGLRDSPIRAVVVTNGDVDHIAGLLTLRERGAFTLCATPATLSALADNPVFGVLDPAFVSRQAISLDHPFTLLRGLEVTAYAAPGKVPLYLEGETVETRLTGEQTVGLRLAGGGRIVHYLPGCADLLPDLIDRLEEADVILFDGTVWADDDMIRSGTGPRTGARMGHMAMSGAGGSLARLSHLRARRIYTHVNNTNPVLLPGPEREAVLAAGWEIAFDGMEIA